MEARKSCSHCDYNECSSYRTVSITSCLGKRFEYISSQRLIAVFDSVHFDVNQFAYLKNRSSTQALLILVEEIKKGLIDGQKAGAVFYDFTDAFGSVSRDRLLYKLGKDFGISGRLFLHIQSFLSDRYARLKMSDGFGNWIASLFGTSAGTLLGPLLFIANVHDVPKCILPKFADDLVALSVSSNYYNVEKDLQSATDQLSEWAKREGMELNTEKTKVMLFGDLSDRISITLNGIQIENVDSFKYLGVLLDKELSFSQQTDYAVGKVKRATAKVARLIDGRHGIPIEVGINLYKTIVRPHMEHALPVWACLSDKDLIKLENAQTQCLRKIIGAKAHSSTAGVEVIAGIPPFRLRRREICCREFIRIMSNSECHLLSQLLQESSRVGLRFCPLEYIKVLSKELSREIGDCNIMKPCNLLLNIRDTGATITCLNVCSGIQSDVISYSTEIEMSEFLKAAITFIEQRQHSSIMVFTDGSVFNSPVGCGACSAVLFPVSVSENVQVHAKPVGNRVTSVHCEVEGIILGIETALRYLQECQSLKSSETIYILCDCIAAINTVNNKSESNKYAGVLMRLQDLCDLLNNSSASVKLVHIPGHAGIEGNEIADVKAREVARDIHTGRISVSNDISVYDGYKIAAHMLKKSWQRKWNEENTGRFTYSLIPDVSTKIVFPRERDIGISYCRMLLHDTLLNDDGYRSGIAESRLCSCGEDNETVEHFLLQCPNYNTERSVMVDTMKDIWINSKEHKKWRLDITESLLLAPYSDSACFTKKDNNYIKEAVFHFLASVDRHL